LRRHIKTGNGSVDLGGWISVELRKAVENPKINSEQNAEEVGADRLLLSYFTVTCGLSESRMATESRSFTGENDDASGYD
jgi:hypothetical protein